jgi:Domain of Unknown Function (DUF1080)
MNRRDLFRLTAATLAGSNFRASAAAPPVSLFDGKTLNGWIQLENNATLLSTAAIADLPSFIAKINAASDPLSARLRSGLSEATRTALASYNSSSPDAKATAAALIRELNELIYTKPLRDGTSNGSGYQLARPNKLLLEDTYPNELVRSATTGWIVKDGAMASTGVGRGVIYTGKDYGRFRLTFTMRHISGNPDHQACVLIFCTRPTPDGKPLDALGGIQFQVPNGGHWDYRPGMNNNGGAEFSTINKTHFDIHDWSGVEIVADSTNGTARMTVAQPPGSKAVEVLDFKDPAAGKVGPIAWQMHNAGLFDEYKDVSIEPA